MIPYVKNTQFDLKKRVPDILNLNFSEITFTEISHYRILIKTAYHGMFAPIKKGG